MVPHERQSPVSRPMKNRMRSTIMLLGILLHAILTSAFCAVAAPEAEGEEQHEREQQRPREGEVLDEAKEHRREKERKADDDIHAPLPLLPGNLQRHAAAQAVKVLVRRRANAQLRAAVLADEVDGGGRTCIR